MKTISMKDKEFNIVQLTDIHIFNLQQLAPLKETIDYIVRKSSPDLFVLTGDIFCAGKQKLPRRIKPLLKSFVQLFDSFEIPWAYIFGNHDTEFGVRVKDFAKAFSQSEFAIFEKSPQKVAGRSNYFVNVSKANKIVYTLFMIDSGKFSFALKKEYPKQHFDYIKDSQVDWYEQSLKTLTANYLGKVASENKLIPSLIFTHIPQIEFLEMRQKIIASCGINILSADNQLATPTNEKGSKPNYFYPHTKSKLIERAAALKSTRAIFVGHLHKDKSNYIYKDIELVQGSRTLIEKPEANDKSIATQITITSTGKMSWKRI